MPTLNFNLRHVVMKLGNGGYVYLYVLVRVLETNKKTVTQLGSIVCSVDTEVGWYAGVVDLNPAFLEREDAIHFHKTLKEACDKHDASHYLRFKKW